MDSRETAWWHGHEHKPTGQPSTLLKHTGSVLQSPPAQNPDVNILASVMGQLDLHGVQGMDAKDSSVGSLVSAMQHLDTGSSQNADVDVDVANNAPKSPPFSIAPIIPSETHKISTGSAAWMKYRRSGTTSRNSARRAVTAAVKAVNGCTETAKDRRFRDNYGRGYQLSPSSTTWSGLYPRRDVLRKVHEKRRRHARLPQLAISKSAPEKMQLDREIVIYSLTSTIVEPEEPEEPDEMSLDGPRSQHMLQPTVLDSEPDEMQLDSQEAC
jgi:hypothetical protein